MIRIITDSMSDYIHTPHRDPDVRIACQPVRFGMEEFMDDGATITQADFYARLHTCPELPKTSLVAMQTWKDALKDALANPDDTALIIAGSSKLSGGYQTAMQAQRWPKLSPLWRHPRDVSASSAWRTTSNTSSWAPDFAVPVYIGGADCPKTTAMLRQMFINASLSLPEIRCVSIGA